MARIGLGLAFALVVAGAAHAEDRKVPARTLPVPTDVSPQVQAMLAQPIRPDFNVTPKTGTGGAGEPQPPVMGKLWLDSARLVGVREAP